MGIGMGPIGSPRPSPVRFSPRGRGPPSRTPDSAKSQGKNAAAAGLTVFLVRHAERADETDPSWTARDEAPGLEHDPPITSRGRAMAMASAGAIFKMLRRQEVGPNDVLIYTSPAQRTVETAAWIAAAFDVKSKVVPALASCTAAVREDKNSKFGDASELREALPAAAPFISEEVPPGTSKTFCGATRELISDAIKKGVKTLVIVGHREGFQELNQSKDRLEQIPYCAVAALKFDVGATLPTFPRFVEMYSCDAWYKKKGVDGEGDLGPESVIANLWESRIASPKDELPSTKAGDLIQLAKDRTKVENLRKLPKLS